MKNLVVSALCAMAFFLFGCRNHCNFCGGNKSYDEFAASEKKVCEFRKKVNHIIIIYQENWSFDGLYGKFPGANNLSCANTEQLTRQGLHMDFFEQPKRDSEVHRPGKPDTTYTVKDYHFNNVKLPARPYDLRQFVAPNAETGDITHLFYTEQRQIDSGKMDKFAAWSMNAGLVQSYFDATNLPEGLLAQQYTLCDNFFHSAFGGSFLNHMWLIGARSPEWKTAPYDLISIPGDTDLKKYDRQVTPDGYVVNTSFSVYNPRPKKIKERNLVPPQTYPTIGDRLNDHGIDWAWFAGGWNDALAGHPDELFEYHHQPFMYFASFKDSSANKRRHLRDENDFYECLQHNSLPQVSFIKMLGEDDEHPGYSALERGQRHVDSVVKLVMASKYWDDAVIIIAYDEHGGRWDHVAPPKIDRWGPGTRVPCIVISKYARKHFVDHTQYETVSILKLIESRFGLRPLTQRDSAATNLLNALDFSTPCRKGGE